MTDTVLGPGLSGLPRAGISRLTLKRGRKDLDIQRRSRGAEFTLHGDTGKNSRTEVPVESQRQSPQCNRVCCACVVCGKADVVLASTPLPVDHEGREDDMSPT